MEKLQVIDSETLLNTPFPKQFFVVEGLIPQGLSVFCGQSKIGKSWLMLYMGLQVSQGLPVMGCNTNKCDVLYLCLEDTYPRLRDRVYKLSDTGSSNLYLTIMAGGIGTGIEEQIEDFLTDYPETKFIMIDTLQKIRDNNKPSSKQGIYGDDYDDISSIKAIADKHNIAIMLVHHVRKLKDSEDPFNSVNMWTGKKFNCNKGAYYYLRALSDEICKEHGLYVIENPSGKTPRNIYFAEKNKEPTKFNLMREAIDFAITCSGNHNDFRKIMRELGYVVELNPNRTYWTIRSLNSKKNVRMFRLGADYTNQRIMERIRAEGNNRFQKGYEFWDERKAFRKYQPKKIYLNGSLKDSRKISGLNAFYYLFATLLGLYPKQNPHKPLSPEMKEAWLKIDRFSEEIRLVHKENLNDLGDVSDFITSVQTEIESTESARQKIYNRLRRCSDPDERSELFSKRDECTERLRQLRKQKKIAVHITEDNSEIKEKIQIERQAQDRLYGREPKENYRKRGYLR